MTSKRIVPWRDDCLLPEESLYSVISKIAWFQAMPPLRYLSTILGRSYAEGLVLGPNEKWLSNIRDHHMAPDVGGLPFADGIAEWLLTEKVDTPIAWRSRSLRVCDHCLADGVHLRIHQDLAVHKCPLHMEPLHSTCGHCFGHLTLSYARRTEAFCCPRCSAPLTAGHVFGMPRPETQRQAVQTAVRAVRSSVLKVRKIIGPHVDSVLRPSSSGSCANMSHLRLDSVCAQAGVHPALRRLHIPKVELKTESVKFRTADDRAAHPGGLIEACSMAEFQLAMSCIVRWFVKAKGRSHGQCLDSPLRMFGPDFGLSIRNAQDILGCCPVATGFWLWRLSNCRQLERYLRQPPSEDAPIRRHRLLILYKALKSHLHYCLHVAQRMLHTDLRHLDDQLRVQALHRVWAMSVEDLQFSTLRSVSSTLVRYEMQWRWMDVPCDGFVAYATRLRRQCQEVEAPRENFSGGPLYGVDVEPPAEGRARMPFTLMRLEGFLR